MQSDELHAGPRPGPATTIALTALLGFLMVSALAWLLSVDDTRRLSSLIEDDGPTQLVGQVCITLAFAIAVLYALIDASRRTAYLHLSYLLLFYTLREADYHYKVSPYAKATQFKRFYLHESIPLSTKLMLATLVILFLVVLYRYLSREKAGFIRAVGRRTPWAIYALLWAGIFILSQLVDQIPIFHTVHGQVFEEVFESSAQVLALIAMILFRVQVNADRLAAPHGSPALE